MKLLRKVGATSEIWQIFVQDSSSTTGAGLTGLTNASSSLTAYYHRDTDTTATVISLVTMTVGTFTSSGFKEIDATNMPGWYQFCPPNAALASGAKSCGFHLKGATNMAPLTIEVDLDAQVDVTFWNGTAVSSPATAGIPDVNVKNINNVAAATPGASGGLFIAGTNAATTVTTSFTTTFTGNLTGSVASVTGAVGSVTGNVGGNVVGSTASVTGAVGSVTGNVGGNVVGSVASVTTVSAGAITPTSFSASTGLAGVRTATAQGGAASTLTLDSSASAVDDFYTNCLLQIVSGTGAGQGRVISAYVGSTKIATVYNAWKTTPNNTSVFVITASDLVGTDPPTAAQIATAIFQDTTAGDFTVVGSIGKSLFTNGAVPGAAGGLFIAGTNAATSVNITGNITGNLSGSVGSVTAGVVLTSAGLDSIVIESGLNARQAISLICAEASGEWTKGATIVYSGAGVATPRITATVDSTSRTVVLAPPA